MLTYVGKCILSCVVQTVHVKNYFIMIQNGLEWHSPKENEDLIQVLTGFDSGTDRYFNTLTP